ncbi:MAG: class II glutamine amidotransferase, partial [Candidatus Tectomicrobia bacterium]|nr:class II glutamine amidotransferase [Candidatus Tectomicrobia bacterium]
MHTPLQMATNNAISEVEIMCGIAGIVGRGSVSKKLLSSIKNLEYRGYDSCGFATIFQGEIQVRKNVGNIDEVNAKEKFLELKGNTGIAHTRWATHGGVTKDNSHPHTSCHGDFVLAHNGIISNYARLKKELIGRGHRFTSETDTEVIVHLLEEHYSETHDVEKALLKTIREDLEGTYAFAFMTTHDPERIFCTRKESPLVLGIGDDGIYLGSDVSAFIEYTRNVVYLNDGEYAAIGKDHYFIKNTLSGDPIERQMSRIDWDFEETKKGGYPHFMLKEIHQG